MPHSGIFVLVLWSLMTCSFGFTVDRSVALVPPAWDTAPSLDTYQRVFVDPTLKSKVQVTGMDKIVQADDAKTSESTSKNQTHEKRSITDNIETEMKVLEIKPIDKIAMMNDDSSEGNANAIITPRNVILLLIDERGQNKEKEKNSWKDYRERLPFAIDGFLQSCHHKIESANFSTDNTSVSEKKEKNCNCERALRSNIGELLSWARQTRGMTTGAVSGSNFSIPFFPKYEFSGSNESNTKLEQRKSKRDSNEGWQVIDISDQAKSVSPLITIDPKTGGASQSEEMNYDATWDIFDVFSKIRMAFFRSLLESLHRDDGGFKNEFSSRKPFVLKPTATNLIGNTIRELRSIPNDKGYMLIAVVPGSEGTAAVDLLREVSLKNTLLIVTQICGGNQSSVPFVAQGPNYRILQEIRVIDELPFIIKKAMITNDCHDTGCTNRQRRAVPIASHVPIGEIFTQELPVLKRVIRNKNAEKPTVKVEETTIGEEIQARSTASSEMIPCDLVTVLGVTTSILIKAAISSS